MRRLALIFRGEAGWEEGEKERKISLVVVRFPCCGEDMRFETPPPPPPPLPSPPIALPRRSKGDRPPVSPPPLAISPGGAAPRMYVGARVLGSYACQIRLEGVRRFPPRGHEKFFRVWHAVHGS